MGDVLGAGNVTEALDLHDYEYTVWAMYLMHGWALGVSWLFFIPVSALLVRYFRYVEQTGMRTQGETTMHSINQRAGRAPATQRNATQRNAGPIRP
jgi:hypothetical protein